MTPTARPSASCTGSRSARRAVIADRASRSEASSDKRLALGGFAAAQPVGDLAHRQKLETETLMPDEIAHELVRRMLQDLERRSLLHDPAPVHDRDPGGETQRLLDVVGHEDDRFRGRLVNARELGLQGIAGDRVDRGEGLVHQQQLGIGGERAGDADPLLLAARQLMRVFAAIDHRVEAEQFEQLADPVAHLRPRPFQQPRHGGDVVLDRPMRKQTDRLDGIADPPAQRFGRNAGHVLAADPDRCRHRSRSAG